MGKKNRLNLPDIVEISVLRRGVDENGVEWQQRENFTLDDIADEKHGAENFTPNKAKMKDTLGVSNQTKAESVPYFIFCKIMGLDP